jgi:hypothetical protein
MLIFLIRILRKLLRISFSISQSVSGIFVHKVESVYLLLDLADYKYLDEIKERLSFYAPNYQIEIVEIHGLTEFDIIKKYWKILLSPRPILVFGKLDLVILTVRKGTFNIDYRYNPTDGWEWCYLSQYLSTRKPNNSEVKKRFQRYLNLLKKEGLKKTYLFGTGPSLGAAIDRDWSDGYRIVCNTIVRDQGLWNHLKPHFIVAGDAIYHFGFNDFACAFRQDLVKRLHETKIMFIYPAFCDEIVQREFQDLSEQLLPIPCKSVKYINTKLVKNFYLPSIGNVLNNILLPLGCALTKDIFLWGFDGRAPSDTDKLFWSNSSKHNYDELMHQIQKKHPAFFDSFVPKNDPFKYQKETMGNVLARCLEKIEKEGFYVEILHPSWNEVLQARYKSKS